MAITLTGGSCPALTLLAMDIAKKVACPRGELGGIVMTF